MIKFSEAEPSEIQLTILNESSPKTQERDLKIYTYKELATAFLCFFVL